MRIFLGILLCAAAGFPRTAGADEKLDNLLQGIQRTYRHLSSISVPYTREVITRSMSMLGNQLKGDVATGQIFFKPPFHLRLEQETPNHEILLADESTLWWYIPDKKQAYRYPTAKYGQELRLLSNLFRGLERVERSFQAAFIGRNNRGADLLELRPTPGWEEIERIVVAVGDGFEIREVVLYNILGSMTHFKLDDMSVNEEFDPGFFTFQVPEGVDVIVEE